MSAIAETKWGIAKQIESSFRSLLTEGQPTFIEIDLKIQELRLACQETIFLDFEYATGKGVGKFLWEAHLTINMRYRKLLDRMKKSDQRLVKIDRRKLEKHYADFLKTSQHFYKSYIQRLVSHFGGIKKLARVAQCMDLDLLSAQESISIPQHTSEIVEADCHATLLRIGDLYRYRNMIRTKDRSWDNALGFYNLANDLCPGDGLAHNQMAVISLVDQNHLDAVYHLYRAMTSIQADLLAPGNLEIEFKKIISAWEKKRGPKGRNKTETFAWWFVLLHAQLYEGIKFSTHYELENEVLKSLVPLLLEHTFEDTLHKFVLISIAAQANCVKRISENQGDLSNEKLQSFYFCLSFNIHTMSVLLQTLTVELDNYAVASAQNKGSLELSDQLPPRACHIIPALRQYSVWLANSCEFLVEAHDMEGIPLKTDASILWKLYAQALTKIASCFTIFKLTRIHYLLPEDANTEGFEPFQAPGLSDACNLYLGDNKVMKPRVTDRGVQKQDSKLEMESRLLDIIVIAISLTAGNKIPLKLGEFDGHFVHNEEFQAPSKESMASSPFEASASGHYEEQMPNNRRVHCGTSASYDHKTHLPKETYAVEPIESGTDVNQRMDTDMLRMVDDLVDPYTAYPDETSYGMHSGTANEIFAPMGSNGYANRLQSTPAMLPSLPGLYTNAFTPQANELQASSPHRYSTDRQLSPLSLSTHENRLSAASALEEMTGFAGDFRSTWSLQSRNMLNPASHSVNQSLQQSLASMYQQSSGFTNSSSLYPDATQQRFNGIRGSRPSLFAAAPDNNSTVYPGASDFERNAMLQSSIWNGSQQGILNGQYSQTPPGGQG